jgi:hypothetical protein
MHGASPLERRSNNRLVRSKEKMSGILFRNQYEYLNSVLAGSRSRYGGRDMGMYVSTAYLE